MTTRTPWSAAAISGFVLSLLGCTGVAAPLGIIFGIIGIARTGGGRRRGRGLAIAAIPISVLTGLLSLLVVIVFTWGVRVAALSAELPAVFDGNASAAVQAVAKLRQLCSDEFAAAVGTERLQAWLEQVANKHGRLAAPPRLSPVRPSGAAGTTKLSLEGKFVNGPANITITLGGRVFRPELQDIEVDGVSPQGSE